MSLYQETDRQRIIESEETYEEPFRTEFWKDYARLIHCPAFRRLQGKTQLYPSLENDYFRTRLTHSKEVSQIAKTIARKLNYEQNLDIDTDLVEFASLAHDIGHPPFGHQGEEALDECMLKYGGFEGNAQTLRVLTRIEKKIATVNTFDTTSKKDLRVGLNLTYRSIASILKYDSIIPENETERYKLAEQKNEKKPYPVKGYNKSEADIVEAVKEKVLNGYKLKSTPNKLTGIIELEKFKTIECQIMDISDDIAYSTYDLDDTLKANFCHPFDIVFPNEEIVNKISKKVSRIFNRTITLDEVKDILYKIFTDVFYKVPDNLRNKIDSSNIDGFIRYAMDVSYRASQDLAQDGLLRNGFASKLIKKYISSIEYIPHEYPPLSTVKIKDDIRLEVEVLKTFNYEVNIQSPRLKIPAFRGKQIVREIFDILTDDEQQGYMLMPNDFRDLYLNSPSDDLKYRTVCDFIAGMTDKYCIEFYTRLTSENAETFFKPI
ncbi:MAG: dNTP triphosphohydrolase [Chitinophagaceae bacterium]|nr:dNTP triphosphohydrolase [Chitinophagaceae bacterium]